MVEIGDDNEVTWRHGRRPTRRLLKKHRYSVAGGLDLPRPDTLRSGRRSIPWIRCWVKAARPLYGRIPRGDLPVE